MNAPLIKPTWNPDANKRIIDNTPDWMAKAEHFQEDTSLKNPHAFVISAQFLLVEKNVPYGCAVPLIVSDGLPAA